MIKRGKEAQALVISLWILAVLTVLAISSGHRVSLGLRLSRYSMERVKAYSLARGGIQRGIIELENDKKGNQYDTLLEAWSAEKLIYDNRIPVYMSDEERKININTASDSLLSGLLEEAGLESADAPGLARYIRIWRGDNDPGLQAEGVFFLNFKKKPLVVPEELIPILSLYYQNKGELNFREKAKDAYASLKYLITVFAGGAGTRININTASRAILRILAKAQAGPEQAQFADALAGHIIDFRESDEGPFSGEQALEVFSEKELAESEEKNLLNEMKPFLTVSSDWFRISSTGNAGKISKKITAVYNRENKKLVYWHEN